MPRSSPVVALLSLVSSLLVTTCLWAQEEPPAPAAPAWEPIEVSGRVVDADGEPRTDLAVRLERAPLPGSPTPEPVATTTDETGVFRARVPEPGFWRATLVPDPDGAPVTVAVRHQPVVEPLDFGDLVAGEPPDPPSRLDLYGLLPAGPAEGARQGDSAPLTVRLVTAEHGRPIAGALVRLLPDTGTWSHSDPEGLLVVPPFPDDQGRRRLVIHAAGREILYVSPGELEDGQELPLEAAISLSGHAVDETGSGLADVRIGVDAQFLDQMAPRPAVRTDSDGAFTLSVSGDEDRLLARHPLRAPAELVLDGSAARVRSTGLVIAVPRGLGVVGAVVDPTGRPVAGVTVYLERQQDRPYAVVRPRQVETDDRGRFALDQLAVGTYQVLFRAPGHPDTRFRDLELRPPGGPAAESPVDLGTFALEPGIRVVGRVTDGDGLPLEHAEVTWRQRRASFGVFNPFTDGGPPRKVLTDSEGRFEIVELAVGVPAELQARRKGYLDASTTVPPVTAGEVDTVSNDADPLLLVLSPAGAIVGRVVGPDDEPVAGVRFSAQAVRGVSLPPHQGNSVATDPDGRFELPRVPPGRVELLATAQGWVDTRETVTVEAGGEPARVTVVLDAGASLSGTVLDPAGQPLVGATVRVHATDAAHPIVPSAAWRYPTEPTGRDGGYALRGVATGEAVAQVDHDEFVVHEEPIALVAGANHRDFRLTDRGRSAAGRVTMSDGLPVSGAWVSASPVGPPLLGHGTSGQTDDDGSFVLRGLPAEPVSLAVSSESGRTERELDLSNGSMEGIEVVLGGSGRLLGRLVGLDAERLRKTEVLVRGPAFHWPPVAADGTFTVESVGPGEWRITVSPQDGRRIEETVVVQEDGIETTVEIDLTPGEIAIDGLLLVDGEPAGNHTVWIALPGQQGEGAATDANGRFRFTRLQPGDYWFAVYSSMGILHHGWALITGSDDLTLEVETVDVAGSLVDPATGRGLAGIDVRLIDAHMFERNGGNPSSWGSAAPGDRTDASGRFEIGPVGARRYLLVVGGQEPAAGQLVDLSSGRDVVGLVVSPPGG